MITLKEILINQFRFLTFRKIKIDFSSEFRVYALYVVLMNVMVGVGRYWDHSSAEWWQYCGLGSLGYIFILSALLFTVLLPFPTQSVGYRSMLVFVGFTALPGALYAIPVERFMSMAGAQQMNAAFLAVVAVWRVSLYVYFLHAVAALHWFRILVVTLLPLTAIVVALALFNLEHVVYDLMSGLSEEHASGNDHSYMAVLIISWCSVMAFPVVVISYVVLVCLSGKRIQPFRKTRLRDRVGVDKNKEGIK